MSNFLGMSLKIRSMIHMAAEPIPFFWPMRTFIHHNPLHGLEHLPVRTFGQRTGAVVDQAGPGGLGAGPCSVLWRCRMGNVEGCRP